MKRFALPVLATALVIAGTALAAEPQEMRQEAMKKAGGAAGTIAKMLKGEAPFDQATAKAAFATMAEVAGTFPDYFPAGSETGFDTEASPKIWENMDDFKAHSAKLEQDATAASMMDLVDAAALGGAMKTVAANCGGCHELYRIKK
ncbi:MAG: cytochrome c [Rhodoblastus sp.]|nr:cytochrome c [Rhodoblastus sp.]